MSNQPDELSELAPVSFGTQNATLREGMVVTILVNSAGVFCLFIHILLKNVNSAPRVCTSLA